MGGIRYKGARENFESWNPYHKSPCWTAWRA